MVLLAALEVLLWRYTGQTDLVVASPVRNRPRPEIEDVVGLFTNTLMLRNRLHPSESFRELVKRVRAVTLDAFTHQEVPFDLLAQEAPPLRILFSLQEGRHRETNLGPVKLTLPPDVLPPAAALDVTLWVVEMEEGLKGALSYSSELFDRETMQRLLRHYRQLLASALSDSRRPLTELSLASPEELRRVEALGRGPAEAMASPRLRDLVVLNRRRAPEEEALTSRRGSWAGSALSTRVEGLARWLQAEGVGSGVHVGLALEDETDRLLALLAVFRAGAVAVPLDRNPASRLEAGVSAARVTYVVTEPDLADEIGSPSLRALTLPSEAAISLKSWALVDGTSEAALLSLVPRPEGGLEAWATPQRHLESALAEVTRMLDLGPEDVVAVTPEAGPLAALLPFFAGARLFLVDAETAEEVGDLARAIDEAGATVLVAVPETLRALLASPPAAPKLRLLSSEILPEGLAAELAAKWDSVFSVYGVEEAGVWNALARVGTPAAYPRVGHALAGNDLLVLDGRGMPSPVDVPGELVLEGSGLALVEGAGGDKDCEPDPGRPGCHRLHTGDRARYRSDGSLELLGRGDGRLRLRGRRLERAEIGACLLELPDLRDAQVLVRHDRRGQPRLVAYVVRRPGTTGTDTDLRRHLRQCLPEVMVPAHFVALDALPRRADGQLDEGLLPTPAALRAGEGREEPPRTSEERLLAELWSQSLGVRDVTRRDNFFDLGGHSLLCLQMVSQIAARTGKRIKPRLLLLSSLEQVAAELAGIEPGRA